MSILNQVTEGEKHKFNGLELSFKSPHVDKDIEELLEGKKELPMSEQMALLKRLVKKMLKESIPDATEQELDDCMRIKTLLPLINIFYEVTGMGNKDNISNSEKMQNVIEQRRAVLKSKGIGEPKKP